MIEGFATSDSTINFLKKHNDVDSKNFRKIYGLTLSNTGVGTYLGKVDDETDDLVKKAVKKSILAGINVIDTAINYRSQKAERSVGKAISELIQ